MLFVSKVADRSYSILNYSVLASSLSLINKLAPFLSGFFQNETKFRVFYILRFQNPTKFSWKNGISNCSLRNKFETASVFISKTRSNNTELSQSVVLFTYYSWEESPTDSLQYSIVLDSSESWKNTPFPSGFLLDETKLKVYEISWFFNSRTSDEKLESQVVFSGTNSKLSLRLCHQGQNVKNEKQQFSIEAISRLIYRYSSEKLSTDPSQCSIVLLVIPLNL